MTVKEELHEIALKATVMGKTIFEENGYNSFSWLAMILGDGDDDKAMVMCPQGVPPGSLYEVMCGICNEISFDVRGLCMIMDTFALSSKGMEPDQAKEEIENIRAGDLSKGSRMAIRWCEKRSRLPFSRTGAVT